MLSTPGRSPRHIALDSPAPSGAPESRFLDGSSSASSSKPSPKLLMGPPPARSKRNQIVLDEDTYVGAIEKIVERDFFPDIPKLQNRLEWLEAVRTGDPIRIREAQENIVKRRGLKAREVGSTPSVAGTPLSVFETPSSHLGLGVSPALSLASQVVVDSKSDETSLSSRLADTNLSLDAFLQKYTSEDNASFSAINENDNKRRLAKQKHYLQIEGSQDPDSAADKNSRKTDGYGSTGQPVSTLISWIHQPKNLLMYNSSDLPELPLTQEELEERTHGPPKEVVKRNTRFHGDQLFKQTKEEDTVAILYTPVNGTTPHMPERGNSNQTYDLEDLRKNSQAAGGEYSFVSTPSPAPGVDASPFMTWGEIEGTPLRLEAEDTPVGIGGTPDGPRFKIPPTQPRDRIAHGLSQSASRSIRDRARIQTGFSTPTRDPASMLSPRLGSTGPSPLSGGLSPAARKLMNKTLKRKSSSVDENLRASYTGGTPVRGSKSRFYREGSLPLRSPSMSPAVNVRVYTPSSSTGK